MQCAEAPFRVLSEHPGCRLGGGSTANITIRDEWTGQGDPPAPCARYHDLALYYASNGNLWMAVNDSWTLDGQGQPTDYQVSGIALVPRARQLDRRRLRIN